MWPEEDCSNLKFAVRPGGMSDEKLDSTLESWLDKLPLPYGE